MNTRRWKILVCLLLVALSGAVIGGVATHWWMTHHTLQTTAQTTAVRLQRVLQLDTEHTAQLRTVLERWLAQAEAMPPGDVQGRAQPRRQFMPQMRALLMPEQQERFDGLFGNGAAKEASK
jgi:hypothetical protein